jgi:chromosome segregation ATPase
VALVTIAGAAGASAALYKWVDEKGRIQYSDKPPPDKSGVEMTNRGIVVKKIDGGLTPEQKKAKDEEDARKKLEEQKAAEQRRLDAALLQSFSNPQEIDMKRDREVQTLESVIANLRGQERSLNERIAEDRRRTEYYLKTKKPVPDSIKDDIARGEAEKKVIAEEITRRQQEIQATRNKYETLKKRYVELRPAGDTTVILPTAAPQKSAAKK